MTASVLIVPVILYSPCAGAHQVSKFSSSASSAPEPTAAPTSSEPAPPPSFVPEVAYQVPPVSPRASLSGLLSGDKAIDSASAAVVRFLTRVTFSILRGQDGLESPPGLSC